MLSKHGKKIKEKKTKKEFTCEECKKTFTRKYFLDLHKKRWKLKSGGDPGKMFMSKKNRLLLFRQIDLPFFSS